MARPGRGADVGLRLWRLQHVGARSTRCSAARNPTVPERSRRRPAASRRPELPPDSDLVFTRAAVSEVLNRPSNDASVPWENPRSGARGTVTPIASAYTQDGQTCRDFLASYVNGSAQSWLQGRSLQASEGRLGSPHHEALEVLRLVIPGRPSKPEGRRRTNPEARNNR